MHGNLLLEASLTLQNNTECKCPNTITFLQTLKSVELKTARV